MQLPIDFISSVYKLVLEMTISKINYFELSSYYSDDYAAANDDSEQHGSTEFNGCFLRLRIGFYDETWGERSFVIPTELRFANPLFAFNI